MIEQPQKCPWCTGDVESHESEHVIYIECCDCHATGPEEESEDEAIRQWNAVKSPIVIGAILAACEAIANDDDFGSSYHETTLILRRTRNAVRDAIDKARGES